MKVYNYISMLLLVGTAIFVSCSQDEEMSGENMDSLQRFQISVLDGGFQDMDANKTRATESDYSTKFVEGDAIGVFAVRNEAIVGEINNRKFTMQDGIWTLDDGGDEIEYKGSEFQRMNFYAYYPYDPNVTFEPAKTNPFETYVNNWKVGADQSEGEYTKYDLMTSIGAVDGDRLKGKIAFTMKHQMALAVIQMPEIVYDFTNANIDDYTLPAGVGSFTLNDVDATPYYQESTDTYRFLVNPNKPFSIKGTYEGVRNMEYTADGSLENGTAKKYTINDPNKIDFTLAVGDYYCADGRIVSKDAVTVPDNVIGIVCYVGNPQPSALPADPSYTEDNDALRRDYPNCKHGLVIALNNADVNGTKVAPFANSRDFFYGSWFTTDEDWMGKFISSETRDPLPGILGYNNAVLMENSPNKTLACDGALNYINAYRTAVPVPASACEWFLPSLRELADLVDVVSTVNTKIAAAGGEELIENGGNGSRYWSSNERPGNSYVVYQHNLVSGGISTPYRSAGSTAGVFRMMLAF